MPLNSSDAFGQVNGLRGETETLNKMRARVQYGIGTMRNRSLVFGLTINGKTLPSTGATGTRTEPSG